MALVGAADLQKRLATGLQEQGRQPLQDNTPSWLSSPPASRSSALMRDCTSVARLAL